MDWTTKRKIIGRWISSRENRMSLIHHAAHCRIKYIVLLIIFLKLAKMKEMDEHTAGKPRTQHLSSEQTSRLWQWHLLGDIGDHSVSPCLFLLKHIITLMNVFPFLIEILGINCNSQRNHKMPIHFSSINTWDFPITFIQNKDLGELVLRFSVNEK